MVGTKDIGVVKDANMLALGQEGSGVLAVMRGSDRQILGGGEYQWDKDRGSQIVNCWAVSDLDPVDHWVRLIGIGQVELVPCALVLQSDVRSTLDRFSGYASRSLRETEAQREGVLLAIERVTHALKKE